MCVSQGSGGGGGAGKSTGSDSSGVSANGCVDVACEEGWELWSQLQAAACSGPRRVIGGGMGYFYTFCPPEDYPDTSDSSSASCPLTPPPDNYMIDSQLVLWVPAYTEGPGLQPLPGGCKIPACQMYE